MTYEESDALMKDADFRGRIKVAGLKYADSILNEAITVPAHNTRLKWAQSCMTQPEMTAINLQPPVCMDSAVQLAGSAITDAALQGAVETTVNRLL
jgi:hypothetical protein